MHESEKWKWSRSIVTLATPWTAGVLPGSSVHGILQAKVPEWGAIAFSEFFPTSYNYSHPPVSVWWITWINLLVWKNPCFPSINLCVLRSVFPLRCESLVFYSCRLFRGLMRLLPPISFNVLQEICNVYWSLKRRQQRILHFKQNKHLSAGTVLSVAKLGVLLKFSFRWFRILVVPKANKGKHGVIGGMTPWGHMGNAGSFIIYDTFYRI